MRSTIPAWIWLFAAFAALTLAACADEGAGSFSSGASSTSSASSSGSGGNSALNGSWSGTWLDGGIPSALGGFPRAHAGSGTITAALVSNSDGTVSGSVTMSPDICAEGATEVAQTITVVITGTLTSDTLTFSYDSPLITPAETVTFTGSFPADPILGSYDGSACDISWVGGIRLNKQ